MFHTTTPRRRPAPRRGTILLVVLTLLALFAVVGLSFAFYAESQATASRIAREASARNSDVPPDPTEGANLFLGRLIYPVGDTGADLMDALRGHELARLIYGQQPWTPPNPNPNVVPYNGVGLFSELLQLPLGPGGSPVSTDRREVVNFTYYRYDPNNAATWFVVDPEHTNANGVVRSGKAASQAPLPSIYVGKNAPYTYPDRNNMAVAVVDPNTGQVVVPSFHRPRLFGALDQSNPNPNPNWYTPTGRLKMLRPRPIDQIRASDKAAFQAAVTSAGIPWPIPDSLTQDQAKVLAPIVSQYSEFPYPAPNPDGTITGDVQNLRYANGLQQNDSVWLYAGLPVYNWRGKRIVPLVAPLVIPIDGRLNLNAAGNLANGGTAPSSNMGFGPWEQNLQRLLSNTWPLVMTTKYGGGTNPPGVRTGVTANGSATRPFQPDWNNPSLAVNQTQPSDYARVDWNGAGTAAMVQLPGYDPARPFASNPTWPSTTSTPAGPYDNSDATIEAPNHPSVYNPYFRDPFRMNSPTQPGAYPLFDLKRIAGRYSDKYANYTGQTFVGSKFFNDLVQSTLPAPNNPANSLRQLVTPMSNSFKRPGLAPNFFGDPAAMLQLAAGATTPTLSARPKFDIPTIIANSGTWGTVDSQTTSPAAFRNLRAVLAGVDLNRPLADYRDPASRPADPTTQPWPLSPNSVTIASFNAAWLDRQNLAKDIYARLVVATGANASFPDATGYPVPNAGITPEQMNALRWLAQLAVNIVDYIDSDDISTAFVWNPTDRNNPLSLNPPVTPNPDFDPAQLPNRVVFGMEKPRLVINEVYAEVANLQSETAAGTTPTQYQVRFFLELLNPGSAETDPNNPLYYDATAPGAVPLRYTPSGSGTPYSCYRVQVFRNAANVRTALQAANNVTGYVDATAGDIRLQATLDNTTSTTAALADRVEPNNGAFAADTTTPARNGFGVVGPDLTPMPSSGDQAYIPDPTSGLGALLVRKPDTTATDMPATSAAPSNALEYKDGGGATDTNLTTLTTARHAVLLQRLANPYLPPNDPATGFDPTRPANPYITVDYVTNVQANDVVVNWVSGGMASTRMPPPDTTRFSIGRVQPFTGNEGDGTNDPISATNSTQSLTLKQVNLVGGMPSGQQFTLFRHNATTASPVPTASDDRLIIPFEWLVHLDRRLVSPAELLHVTGFKPHELTHWFAFPRAGGPPGTRPWFHLHDLQHAAVPGVPAGPLNASVANSPLYRMLEVLGVKPWGHGLPEGGRVPGKVNINMLWDENPATGRSRVFDAVMDKQASNTFTDTGANNDLTTIWNAIKQSRSPLWALSPTGTPDVGPTYDEGGASDRPFKSLGAPIFQAAPPGAAGIAVNTDIADTILRNRSSDNQSLFTRVNADPNNPLNPYLSYEPLRKAFNSFTTVSDNYVVLMTVGFFEVREGDPTDPNNPPVLGKEVFDQVPGDMRSQFVAVIDRTRLIAQYANTPDQTTDPTVPNNPNSTAPWVSELQAPFVAVSNDPNAPSPLRLLGEVELDPLNWDGTLATLQPQSELKYSTNAARADTTTPGFQFITPQYQRGAGNAIVPGGWQRMAISGHYDGFPWSVQAMFGPNVSSDATDPNHTGSRFFLNVGNQVQMVEAFFDPGIAQWSYDPVNGIAKIWVRGINMATGQRTVPFRAEVGATVSNVIFGNPGTPGVATAPFNTPFDFRSPLYRPVVRYVGLLNTTP
jgi:hypothetical protein